MSVTTSIALIVHAAATLTMCGVIWFVQVVHYPLFRAVGAEAFTAYERAHVRRTGFVVVPLMLVEAAAALVLVVVPLPGANRWLVWAGLVMLVGIWLMTALVSASCHGVLQKEYHSATVRRLVLTNWLRTVLWSGRGVVALLLLASSGLPASG